MRAIALRVAAEVELGQPIGQCRAVPVNLGADRPPAILAAYGADFDVDPYVEMFFFPRDTLKLVVFTVEGEVLWRRELGRGVVPGMWFCPLFPFDLDGDGVDEIYYVDNLDADHPLGLSSYVLARLEANTGEVTGQWPWPRPAGEQSLSHLFRNFILGGPSERRPVLVTAQGTYGEMRLQGWSADLTPRWETVIAAGAPGARGSHMCPLVDLDRDGVTELLWGERCLRLSDGSELFCADGDSYRGHSDIVQPVWDRESRGWSLYCCREGDPAAAPRVACYDGSGVRRWGALERGHIDMGWVARLDGDRQVATAVRIGAKRCGPNGRSHQSVEEFAFDAAGGEPLELGFSHYRTIPVDLNGDGRHELVRGLPGGDGEVLDSAGRPVGSVGGPVALACKVNAIAGEQLLSYHADGRLRLWHDEQAHDGVEAIARYTHPAYANNRRLGCTGQNHAVLGGI